MNHLIMISLMAAASHIGQVADSKEGSPENQPAKVEQTAADVSAILAALERTGADVRTARCRVVYTVDDALNLTRTVKYGEILFKRAKPHPMFLVRFDKTVADDIVHKNAEWWLFRDRWLSEAKGKSKTIIRREMLRPGEKADMFDLEKSPIPMPFGQKEDEITKNFHVRLMPPQLNDPPNCDHLYCEPKDGSRLAEEFKRLEYYVSRDLHLPIRIVAQNADETKVTTAVFDDLSKSTINIDLKDAAFELPKETKRFNVTEEPIKQGE